MRLPPLLKNRQVDEHSVETWLVSDEPAKQDLAAQTLIRLDDGQRLAYLLSIAAREERDRWRRPCVYISAGVLLLALVTVLVVDTSGRYATLFPLAILWMTSPMLAYLKRLSKLHRRVNALLADESDVSLMPVIVNAWIHGGYLDINVPAKCLARLLPRLSAEDAGMLDKTQWDFLTGWLLPRSTRAMRPEVRRDFVRAILLACGNLERSDALPRVKKLAETKSSDADVQQLQQTARNYVTLLENSEIAHQRPVCR